MFLWVTNETLRKIYDFTNVAHHMLGRFQTELPSIFLSSITLSCDCDGLVGPVSDLTPFLGWSADTRMIELPRMVELVTHGLTNRRQHKTGRRSAGNHKSQFCLPSTKEKSPGSRIRDTAWSPPQRHATSGDYVPSSLRLGLDILLPFNFV